MTRPPEDTFLGGTDPCADRFATYVEELTSVIGHADRAAPLRDYCAGLLTAPAPALGERSRHPFRLAPVIIRHL
jgi:hypothetical protein